MILPVCIEEQVIFISIPENPYIKLSSLMHTVILQDGGSDRYLCHTAGGIWKMKLTL
jgi:hypothetical protein